MNDVSRVADWLTGWIKTNGRHERPIAPDENFLEGGWIDSVGIIELIGAAEAEFGIRFNEDHFADSRFPTVGGLAEIIDVERARPRVPR